jgi:hypothetical protein
MIWVQSVRECGELWQDKDGEAVNKEDSQVNAELTPNATSLTPISRDLISNPQNPKGIARKIDLDALYYWIELHF